MAQNSLRLISWNVNGIRAAIKKGFFDFVAEEDPDILCLQETKIAEADVPQMDFPFEYQIWHSAEKKGYSSTAILSKTKPLSVTTEFPSENNHPPEGRVITAEFESFYLVNVYVPNSKRELLRLPYRQNEFDPDFRNYLLSLAEKKPVLTCGDFNVAHQEIDLANPKSNRRNAGFTDEEREEFSKLLDAGFSDTFRHFHPDEPAQYTWWSYRANARERNIGWRIDYFLASEGIQKQVTDAFILPQVLGSDHCPVGIKLKTNS